MAIMGLDPESKQMVLKGCFQGVSKDDVLENMGFAVDTSRAAEIPPPSAEELVILREKCDPQRLILGK